MGVFTRHLELDAAIVEVHHELSLRTDIGHTRDEGTDADESVVLCEERVVAIEEVEVLITTGASRAGIDTVLEHLVKLVGIVHHLLGERVHHVGLVTTGEEILRVDATHLEVVAHLLHLELEAHDLGEVEVDLVEQLLVVFAQVAVSLLALSTDVGGVEGGIGTDLDVGITGYGVYVELLVVQLGQLGKVGQPHLQHGDGHLLVGHEVYKVEGGVYVVMLETSSCSLDFLPLRGLDVFLVAEA